MRRAKGKAAALTTAGIALSLVLFAAWRWSFEAWWIHQLGSEDSSQRCAAIRSLGEARSRWAVPKLLDRLESLLEPAKASLTRAGPLDRAQILAMATASSPQPNEQVHVVEALCRIGAPAYEALETRPELIARVIPSVDPVRGPEGRVEILLLGLNHPSRATVLQAVEKLGSIGLPASRAIPALLRVPRKDTAMTHVVLRALRLLGWEG